MPRTLVTAKNSRTSTAAPTAPTASAPRVVATEPDPMMVQAKRDLDAGLVDTDMRQTAGLDAERRKRLVPTPTVPSDGHAKRRPRGVTTVRPPAR